MIRKERLKGIWVDYVVAGLMANWPQIKVRFKGHLKLLGSVGYLARGSAFSSRVRPNWLAQGSFRARLNVGQQGGLPPGGWSSSEGS